MGYHIRVRRCQELYPELFIYENISIFNGLNTKNITIQISSKMSKKNREALKKNLKKAKFQGTIKTK